MRNADLPAELTSVRHAGTDYLVKGHDRYCCMGGISQLKSGSGSFAVKLPKSPSHFLQAPFNHLANFVHLMPINQSRSPMAI